MLTEHREQLWSRFLALSKGEVKGHKRKLKSGRVIEVKGHERKDRVKPERELARFSRSAGAKRGVRRGEDDHPAPAEEPRRRGREMPEDEVNHENDILDLKHSPHDGHDKAFVDRVREREHARPGGPRKGHIAILDRHERRMKRGMERQKKYDEEWKAKREHPRTKKHYALATQDPPGDFERAAKHHRKAAKASEIMHGHSDNREAGLHHAAANFYDTARHARSITGDGPHEKERIARSASLKAREFSRSVASGDETPHGHFSESAGAKSKRNAEPMDKAAQHQQALYAQFRALSR